MDRIAQTQSGQVLAIAAAVVVVAAAGMIGFSAMYAGKIYPGVSVNGHYMGGLDKTSAQKELAQAAEKFKTTEIPVQYGKTTLRVPVGSLGVEYPDKSLDAALAYGRQGSLAAQIKQRLRAIFNRPTTVTSFRYDADGLTPFIDEVDADANRAVLNASLQFTNGEVEVVPAQPGWRLDRGQLAMAIGERLGTMKSTPVTAPTYVLEPSINEDTLKGARSKATSYVAAPVTVNAGGVTRTITQADITTWLSVGTAGSRSDIVTNRLTQFYPPPSGPQVSIGIDSDKVEAYVANLAASLDKPAQNAVLEMQGGTLAVARASQPRVALDQPSSVTTILEVLKKVEGKRVATLKATSTPAEVNENNLASLGIKELISEGQTFFPGSTASRLTNVRVGAARFDQVLVKPGETFSFGKILGDVGPAQGYVPELVILGDHEEKQYGGGLCQVASTAYRAALLGGLPIVERHNHSFAVSYYTAPYGVPGVDATIYYPQVDFKFKNDTPGYILIQTIMSGTTLKFDYYGTKTKYGEIRGPQFISGTTDAKQPSHTVFWRDIKDLNGNLIKTNEIQTYYESSDKFPIQHQFN